RGRRHLGARQVLQPGRARDARRVRGVGTRQPRHGSSEDDDEAEVPHAAILTTERAVEKDGEVSGSCTPAYYCDARAPTWKTNYCCKDQKLGGMSLPASPSRSCGFRGAGAS